MLFGVKLQNEVYPPWKSYYIAYDSLKRALKENIVPVDPSQQEWTEKDEQAFASMLDKELEKVYSFQRSKYKELDQEISKLEMQSEKYLESISSNANGNNSSVSSQFDSHVFQNTLEELLALTNELDHFSRLNFTGFIKIVKKHDRLHKGYSVKALLNVRMKSLPLDRINEDTSPYLFRISTLYSFARDNLQNISLSASLTNSIQKLSTSGKISSTPGGAASITGTSFSGGNSTSSGYKVLKFWIHPDNLMEIKTTILRHLPVLIYNSLDDDDDDEYTTDPTITSLYFDNRNFELYNNKLLKNLNKTPSLRLRWSGKLKDQEDLTLEQKIFDYDVGASNEIKLSLKEKYLDGFIFGNKASADHEDDLFMSHAGNFGSKRLSSSSKSKQAKIDLKSYVKKLEKRGYQKETIDKYSSNFKELQDFIRSNDLQPVLRTVHTRTAFQIPGDNRVRITIDSDILFIREDSFDTDRPIRPVDHWHRDDIDSSIENPYSLLRKGEYSKFPYSALEIKISNSIFNKPSSKTLSWVNDLANGHLVKEVPNFSKFVQGISALYAEDDNLDILPFWLPELELDIRKNPEQAYNDSKNKRLRQKEQDDILKNLKRKVGESPKPITNTNTTHLDQILDDDENDADQDLDDNESSDDEGSQTPTEIDEAAKKAMADANLRLRNFSGQQLLSEDAETNHLKPRKRADNVASYLMPIFTKSSKLETYESEDEEIVLPPGVTKPKVLIRQSGPVKVEAKVWLANERTFVRWLHVTTMLSALTFAVYSSVESSHFPGLATDISYIYFALTLFSGLWAYGIYQQRLECIKKRSGRHLDGVFGPLVVAAVLVISLTLEFYAGIKKFNEKNSIVPGKGNNPIVNATLSAFAAPEEFVPGTIKETLSPFTNYVLEKICGFVESF